MQRYHREQQIIENRQKRFRLLNTSWSADYCPTVGKFRKSLRCAGCGKARCQLCHPEKYPKRQLTRKEQQAVQDFKTQQIVGEL